MKVLKVVHAIVGCTWVPLSPPSVSAWLPPFILLLQDFTMADDDKKDEGELEEERISRALSHSKLRGHNAFAATHATPPKKGTAAPVKAASPPQQKVEAQTAGGSPSGQIVGARGPKIVKDANGPLPEWKRVQLEREEAERRKAAEEESRRREYANQIVNSAASGLSTARSSL